MEFLYQERIYKYILLNSSHMTNLFCDKTDFILIESVFIIKVWSITNIYSLSVLDKSDVARHQLARVEGHWGQN